MNYIGSKYSLLEEIESALDIYPIPREGIALDLFAGTGAVSQLLKLHGYITYANDWQRYSYVTNVAFIELNALPDFGTLLADAEWGRCISRLSSGEEIKTYSITTREPLREDIPCAQVYTISISCQADVDRSVRCTATVGKREGCISRGKMVCASRL